MDLIVVNKDLYIYTDIPVIVGVRTLGVFSTARYKKSSLVADALRGELRPSSPSK